MVDAREMGGPFCSPGNPAGSPGNGMPGIIIPGGRKGLGDSKDWGPEVGVSPDKG